MRNSLLRNATGPFAVLLILAVLMYAAAPLNERLQAPFDELYPIMIERVASDGYPDLYTCRLQYQPRTHITDMKLLFENDRYSTIQAIDTGAGMTAVVAGNEQPMVLVLISDTATEHHPLLSIQVDAAGCIPLLVGGQLYVAVTNTKSSSIYQYDADKKNFCLLLGGLPSSIGEFKGQFTVLNGEPYYIESGVLQTDSRKLDVEVEAVTVYNNALFGVYGSRIFNLIDGKIQWEMSTVHRFYYPSNTFDVSSSGCCVLYQSGSLGFSSALGEYTTFCNLNNGKYLSLSIFQDLTGEPNLMFGGAWG